MKQNDSNSDAVRRTLNAERFYFKSFGCKVNQYEVDHIRAKVVNNQLKEVGDYRSSDCVVINTCTVTEEAYKESLKFAKKVRRRNKNARIILTGCAVTSNYDSFTEIEGVYLFKNDVKERVSTLLEDLYDIKNPDSEIGNFTTRYFLKVQDGCELNCSYCIIPEVRGGSISRKEEDVIDEFKRVIKHGYKEVVLTGVHLGSYGKDIGASLSSLIRKMAGCEGEFRIRLSSIEADEVKDDLICLFEEYSNRLCAHLHLPLQSGDDSILRKMRRRYNIKMYMKVIEKLKKINSRFGFTTDIIVGFPSESDLEFQCTMKAAEEVGFHRIHVFPYSPREGTDAATYADLPKIVKRERMRRLNELSKVLFRKFAEGFRDTEVTVLSESASEGYSGEYLRSRIPNRGNRGHTPNSLVRVIVKDVDLNDRVVLCRAIR